MRTSFAGSFMLVEGKQDSRFWGPRVRKDACQLVIADGKNNTLRAIARLDELGIQGVLGIADADLDHVQGSSPSSPNLLLTDTSDLETMLVRSHALERVLAECGDPGRIRQFEAAAGRTVRDELLERGLAFGKLRWLCVRKGVSVEAGQFRVAEFVLPDTWQLDTARLQQRACDAGIAGDQAELLADLAALPAADPWCVCRGHDLVTLLQLGLYRVLGDKGSRDMGAALRLAAQDASLRGTGLWTGIRDWERRNPPFQVLPS